MKNQFLLNRSPFYLIAIEPVIASFYNVSCYRYAFKSHDHKTVIV